MKNLGAFLAAACLIAALGIFCFTQLAIVESPRRVSPSREARENSFFALERWLAARGRTFRVLSFGDMETLLAAQETTVFIEASSFDWSGAAPEPPALSRLTGWVRDGGRLLIALDTYAADPELALYLEFFGVKEYENTEEEDIEDTENTEENVEAENTEKAESSGETGGEPAGNGETAEFDRLPFFDKNKTFIVTENGEAGKISVAYGSRFVYPGKAKILSDKIVFVYIETGKGSIAVTGNPYFLYNEKLREKPNADLAGALLMNGPGGVLFIRGAADNKHLFGSLAERGNPFALLVSAIVLAAAGFWMVIPLFGRFRPVPARPGKPLRERFLAEGRFLLKHGALDKYLSVYGAELEQRRRVRGTGTVPDEAAVNTAAGTKETAGAAKTAAKKPSLRDFMKSQAEYIAGLEELEQHWKREVH